MRSRRSISSLTLLSLLLGSLAIAAPERAARGAYAPPNEWERCLTFDPESGETRIDALCFFDALVDRYRNLTAYEDVANVTHVTERAGEEPKRVETKIGCEIEDGRLRVETPASVARRRLGLVVKPRLSPAMEAVHQRYNLWMAPHMALKFADRPERDFRSGVRRGFVATEAEAVTIDDRPMVHLELTSTDGSSETPDARFDIFVNPESMLVERIQGEQTLPDGARFETRLDITPTHAATEAPIVVDPPLTTVPDTTLPGTAVPGTAVPVRDHEPPVEAGHATGRDAGSP